MTGGHPMCLRGCGCSPSRARWRSMSARAANAPLAVNAALTGGGRGREAPPRCDRGSRAVHRPARATAARVTKSRPSPARTLTLVARAYELKQKSRGKGRPHGAHRGCRLWRLRAHRTGGGCRRAPGSVLFYVSILFEKILRQFWRAKPTEGAWFRVLGGGEIPYGAYCERQDIRIPTSTTLQLDSRD